MKDIARAVAAVGSKSTAIDLPAIPAGEREPSAARVARICARP